MQDLWPSAIGENIANSPVSIMRDQAQLLGQKTQNLIEAEVGIGSPTNGKFVYYFYIVAPTLHDYHFRLFTVEHDIDMYPLTIYMGEALGRELSAAPSQTVADNLSRQANRALAATGFSQLSTYDYKLNISSEDEFIDTLQNILTSQRTRQIISSLLSQVTNVRTSIHAEQQ